MRLPQLFRHCFNRGGDSFLGATITQNARHLRHVTVSIAAAILFWGLLIELVATVHRVVSIAAAILFGGYTRTCDMNIAHNRFNRGGDSFLGATTSVDTSGHSYNQFQSRRRFFFGGYYSGIDAGESITVSIAAAILFWGLQNTAEMLYRRFTFQSRRRFFFGGYSALYRRNCRLNMFQSRRRFFFGGYRALYVCEHDVNQFQSRRRFFFGGYLLQLWHSASMNEVSIAAAILFWGLRMIGCICCS